MIRERTALDRLRRRGTELPWPRIAPALLAGALAATYVAVSPPSLDLAAHLLRAKLFATEGFGIWNDWWYTGHPVVMYGLLFPAVAAALLLGAALIFGAVRMHQIDDIVARAPRLAVGLVQPNVGYSNDGGFSRDEALRQDLGLARAGAGAYQQDTSCGGLPVK